MSLNTGSGGSHEERDQALPDIKLALIFLKRHFHIPLLVQRLLPFRGEATNETEQLSNIIPVRL